MRRPDLILAGLLLLTGCAVGPDYEATEVPLPDEFVNEEGVVSPQGVAMDGLWQSLDNDDLDRLIELALANNTTLRQALATLEETRALSGLAVYSLFPTFGTTAEFERSTLSDQDPFAFPGLGVVERYRAGFDASWEIDLFGSLRRQAEAFRYLAEADEATLYATQLSIVAEVVQTYFQWTGDIERLTVLEANLVNQSDSVGILEAQLDAGRGTAFDVARARAIERQIAAAVPTTEAAVARSLQRLAVLTGRTAAALRDEISEPEKLPAFPRLVTVGEPIDWLTRRPDIRAAERRLASATADIGVSVAEFYPKLNLVGDFGWTGLELDDVGRASAERWRVAPAISWRILDAGRVRQEVLAARARAAGAAAAYDEAWLVALEETENALATYRAATEREARLEEAVAEATDASRLAQLRFEAGADSYLAVLDAERTRIELDDLLAQGRTDRATALAALYKALGGDFARAESTGPSSGDD